MEMSPNWVYLGQALLTAGLVGFIINFLLSRRDLRVKRLPEILTRLALIATTGGIFILCLDFISDRSVLLSVIGGFVCVVSAQTLLGALGFRSDLLANRSIETEVSTEASAQMLLLDGSMSADRIATLRSLLRFLRAARTAASFAIDEFDVHVEKIRYDSRGSLLMLEEWSDENLAALFRDMRNQKADEVFFRFREIVSLLEELRYSRRLIAEDNYSKSKELIKQSSALYTDVLSVVDPNLLSWPNAASDFAPIARFADLAP